MLKEAIFVFSVKPRSSALCPSVRSIPTASLSRVPKVVCSELAAILASSYTSRTGEDENVGNVDSAVRLIFSVLPNAAGSTLITAQAILR